MSAVPASAGPTCASYATPPVHTGISIVQTVQEPIDASKLGFTLPHEDICASSAGFWQVWPESFGGRANVIDKVVEKLKAARDEGVNTIVDVTPADLGSDIRLLVRPVELGGCVCPEARDPGKQRNRPGKPSG